MKWVFTYEQIGGRRWDCGLYSDEQEAEKEREILSRRAANAGLVGRGMLRPSREVSNDYQLSPRQIEIDEEMPKILTLGKEFD